MTREPNTLFHYCRTDIFHSIVSGSSIWLSSLTQSNDFLEGKLLSRLLDDICSNMTLSENMKEALSISFKDIEESLDALGICLSTSGDVLSQWRAYAADGTGVSIGFNRDFLEERIKRGDLRSNLPGMPSAVLKPVIYELKSQLEHLEPMIQELRAMIDDFSAKNRPPFESILLWGDEARQHVYDTMSAISQVVFLLKGYAFREEKEWRLFIPRVNWYRLDKLQYRSMVDQIIPYLRVDLNAQKGQKVINEVILGPKHRSPKEVVEAFLTQCGFIGAKVSVSTASYR